MADLIPPPRLTEPPRLRAVSLNNLEKDVEDALNRQKIGQAVEHVTDRDIGRLSAEAVLAQYEAAAKAVVDTMGEEIKERITKLEASMREADEDMRLIAEAAAAIREKGKLVHMQIEKATQRSKDIRDGCAEFKRKVVD